MFQRSHSIRLLLLSTSLSILFTTFLRADDMYIWAEQVGDDVVFYHQGSIDLTDFPLGNLLTTEPVIVPSSSAYMNGMGNIGVYDMVLPLGPGRPFGAGGLEYADSISGDSFGINTGDELALPVNYESGTPISGTMTFLMTDLGTLGVDTTPFTFNTTVGSNTIHMFTDPNKLAAEEAAEAAARADLLRQIRKLQKKAKKLKKKGKKAKAKKLQKKIKKLKQQLAALG